mgnify:CR=1 FL=1
MKYKSTRGGMSGLSFAEAVRMGLSADGGLFVPEENVTFDREELTEMTGLSYNQLAKKIFSKYAGDFTEEELEDCVSRAYSEYNFPDGAAQLTKLSDTLSVLELWHGPTSAFKDMALQILPQFMTYSAKKCGDDNEIIILTATSGDTGKAALEGFKDIEGIKVMVFYPEYGVSEMQKYQMITQAGSNVNVTAINGNFDNAQSGVKKIFGDKEFAKILAQNGKMLSSANSINWGRLLPQIVYYFYAYIQLVNRREIGMGAKINFCVPTGNFGNILACYYAKKAGLPVNRIICASNDNNVVPDFMKTGVYNKNRKFITTISPAMDILISSNLERLIFDACGENCDKVAGWMTELYYTGCYEIDAETHDNINEHFWGAFATETETSDIISNVYSKYNYLVDPHTAVGLKVYEDYITATGDTAKTVCVSTASPFKFNEAVAKAVYGFEAIAGMSEFEILDFLSKRTGLPVPAPLCGLNTRPVRFKEVCEIDEMKKKAEEFINV